MPSSYHIGPHYESLVRDLVDSGRYTSASEVIRDALRLMEEREELRNTKLKALREAIRQGVESGPAIPAEDVFETLEARLSGSGRNR
jgi:antitoxin ParD1/3/4